MLISDDDAPFQTSLQAAIWRKSFLLSCLANNEDPWTFEKHGTKRLIERRKRGYNGIILGAFSPPLTYCNAVGGEGNKPGQCQKADLGLNPVSEGGIIRLPIPPLTEERRKDMVKLVKKFGEDSKVAVRNIRRDSIETLKKAEKDGKITEDEMHQGQKYLQERTDNHINDR